MTGRDFCYWLQGYLEISTKRMDQAEPLDADQVKCIADHLALVFVHEIDPSAGDAAHQAKLNEIHSPEPAKIYHGPLKPHHEQGFINPLGPKLRC